jgi:SAM-dependent methyltransferase
MRWDILNYLVDKNKYKSYLEIGVQDYSSNCGKIIAEHKVAVDPFPRGKCDFVGTSDEYFDYISDDVKFDLIFIDGLHHSDQVVKDVEKSLKHLNEGGIIVVHDCLPENFSNQVRIDHGGEWTGDVWKAIVYLKGRREDLDIKVVDHDWGCGIIQRGSQKLIDKLELEEITWSLYEDKRDEILSVITEDQFLKLYDNAVI